jgi:DNA-directed RNA polymerase subunit beta'
VVTALKALLDQIELPQFLSRQLSEEVESAKGQRKKEDASSDSRSSKAWNELLASSPESLCLTVLPVIPPDLRPMVQLTGGRFATS